MNPTLRKIAFVFLAFIVCEQGHGGPDKYKRTHIDALDVPTPLWTLIDARLSAIEAARADKPQLFETVDRHLPLFARPVRVRTASRKGVRQYLPEPLAPALLDAETRRIVESYPEVFQQVRVAAGQWLAGAEASLQPVEWSDEVNSAYRDRLEEVQALCSCPPNEFWALVRAAGPHNLQGLPYLDPEYLLAWEAALVREDVSWAVKSSLLPIVFSVRDPESVATLVLLRHMALDCESKRNAEDICDPVQASGVARQVLPFLRSQPTRAALVGLAVTMKQEMERIPRAGEVVPPDTTLIGIELSRSEEWKQLLDTAAAEKDMGEYVALLREAMRLTAGKKTRGRD